jgi:NitT/TauT family transport system permease protein
MTPNLPAERLRGVLYGALGVAAFLGAWEAIGYWRLAGLTWPRLTAVLAFTFDPDRAALFGRAMRATFSNVAAGYALGVALGVAGGALGFLLRPARPGLDRLVAVIHAIPSIALAPILIVLVSRDATGLALTALGVFYAMYVATTSGLEAASAAHRDLFAALGAPPRRRLWHLQLPAALPAFTSGLKFAIPGAFIGAIVGEWFGATRGLGLLMASAMHNFQITLLWTAVLITSCASLLCFGLASLLERYVAARYR